MAKLTASEFSEKWGRRLTQAAEDMRRGVERVSEAPGAKAAQKKDKWIAKMTDPAVQGKWASNVASVPLDQWKNRMVQVGIGRVPSGVEANKDKVAKFGEQLLSHIDAGLAKIQSMPDVTYEQTKARMLAWFDHMAKFRFKR